MKVKCLSVPIRCLPFLNISFYSMIFKVFMLSFLVHFSFICLDHQDEIAFSLSFAITDTRLKNSDHEFF